MVILRRRLMGSFSVEDQNGKKLGSITQKLIGPKYIIKNPQGVTVAYTDICMRNLQNPDSTLLNTEYVLASTLNKEQLAIGFPAYNENVDASILKNLYIKSPLTDRMTVHIQGVDEKLFLRMDIRNGHVMISEIDKNFQGDVHRLRSGVFSVDLRISDDPVLLCGIFLFTRYLLNENKSIEVV